MRYNLNYEQYHKIFDPMLDRADSYTGDMIAHRIKWWNSTMRPVHNLAYNEHGFQGIGGFYGYITGDANIITLFLLKFS